MKKTFLVAASAILVFTGCTEKGPLINFGTSTAKDTTYLAAVETPQNHNILVEEFTGASCPNCPAGHITLSSLAASNPGRLNNLAIHIKGFPQADPVPNATYDFRTDAGTSIVSQFFGSIIGEPCAGIDRVSVGGTLLPYLGQWAGGISTRLGISNHVNMYVKITAYNTSTREASIQTKIAYTATDTNSEFLSLAIVEDSLYDKQDSSLYTLDHYLFNNILRGYVTPIAGEKILDTMSSKPAGTVLIRNYKYTLDAAWIPKHCRIIAFVAKNGANMEVLQSVQAQIVP